MDVRHACLVVAFSIAGAGCGEFVVREVFRAKVERRHSDRLRRSSGEEQERRSRPPPADGASPGTPLGQADPAIEEGRELHAQSEQPLVEPWQKALTATAWTRTGAVGPWISVTGLYTQDIVLDSSTLPASLRQSMDLSRPRLVAQLEATLRERAAACPRPWAQVKFNFLGSFPRGGATWTSVVGNDRLLPASPQMSAESFVARWGASSARVADLVPRLEEYEAAVRRRELQVLARLQAISRGATELVPVAAAALLVRDGRVYVWEAGHSERIDDVVRRAHVPWEAFSAALRDAGG